MAPHRTSTTARSVAASASAEATPTVGTSAKVVDHIGPPRHPHRVTIIQLARTHETYEVRWRENVRQDDGRVTRERRSNPGGHSKANAFTEAEKVWRNLERSGGYHGGAPRTTKTAVPRKVRTLEQVGELWLDQHTGKAGTVEGYQSLFKTCIWPELTWTDTRRGRQIVRKIELGAFRTDEIESSDINEWINALAQKPDARRKGETVPIASSTVDAALTVLKACLTWAVTEKLIDANPAANADVTVHGQRTPEWFRTEDAFWNTVAHVGVEVVRDVLITCAYTGMRIQELAALQWDDVDLVHHRIRIRHNFDKKGRASTVKSEESDTWTPLHHEAKTAIQRRQTAAGDQATGSRLVFLGPRSGRIGSTLINTTLDRACQAAGLSYRVTAHGLRHSLANWLKIQGVPPRDIQAIMRHTDYRTTAAYLHTDQTEKAKAIDSLQGRSPTSRQPNESKR